MLNPFREQKLALMREVFANGQEDISPFKVVRLSLLSQLFEELRDLSDTPMSQADFARMQENQEEIYHQLKSALIA